MELGFEGEHYAELYSLITGKKKTWAELLAVSEKIWHLTRVFNAREIKGVRAVQRLSAATLVRRSDHHRPNEGYLIPMEDIEFLLDAYYCARGWDKNGIPTEATLVEKGLQDVH